MKKGHICYLHDFLFLGPTALAAAPNNAVTFYFTLHKLLPIDREHLSSSKVSLFRPSPLTTNCSRSPDLLLLLASTKNTLQQHQRPHRKPLRARVPTITQQSPTPPPPVLQRLQQQQQHEQQPQEETRLLQPPGGGRGGPSSPFSTSSLLHQDSNASSTSASFSFNGHGVEEEEEEKAEGEGESSKVPEAANQGRGKSSSLESSPKQHPHLETGQRPPKLQRSLFPSSFSSSTSQVVLIFIHTVRPFVCSVAPARDFKYDIVPRGTEGSLHCDFLTQKTSCNRYPSHCTAGSLLRAFFCLNSYTLPLMLLLEHFFL